ncbi:MAG: killer suppression protein [Fibrobacteria bacterium]
MKLVFTSDELMQECNNQKLLHKRYGGELAKALRLRLDELFNAQSLEEMRSLPHIVISGSPRDKGPLRLDLTGVHQLTFRPHPVPKIGHGGMDWKKIDSILILGISG